MDDALNEMLLNQMRDVSTRVYEAELKNMEQTVREHVGRNKRALVAQILGMDARWGDGWQIDHCNGRSGQSLIGTQLANEATPVVVDLVQKALRDWEPTEEMIDAVKAEFNRLFQARAFEYAREEASRQARAKVQELVAAPGE